MATRVKREDGVADGAEVSASSRNAVDVRFRHWVQASGDGEEATGCCDFAAPKPEDRTLHPVSLDRLSPVTKRGTGRTAEQRRPVTLQVRDEDLKAVRDCVVAALGLDCRRLVVENT